MPFIAFRPPGLLSLVTLAVRAYALATPPREACCPNILWTPCSGATQFDCGSFKVPFNYAHPEVGNATLAVARLKATNRPRLGTIFANPGGPGESGVQLVVGGQGQVISTITSGQYDIVSWDPRGVNNSRPQISCGFTSQASLQEFFGDTIPGVGVEARGNFTDQDDLDAFFAKVNETDAKFVQTGQRCMETDGPFLQFMGTAAVARDLVSLSDCIEGPSRPINYWGFSYGTVLGNYFVNMFPERVGRVVLDGVVDSLTWATEPTFKLFSASLSGSEATFEGLAENCAQAGPQNCVIAQNNSTPASISQDVRRLIDTAYDLHKAGSSNISSFSIRNSMEVQLHNPTTWAAELVPQLAAFTAMFANQTAQNPSTPGQLSSRAQQPVLRSRQTMNASVSDSAIDPTVQELFTELVISCVDSIDQEDITTKQVFDEVVRVTQEITPLFGEAVFGTGQPFCHRFPVRAVERFTGPFNQTLVNQILADPITPLAGAQRVASTLGQSARLLEQDGLGHTSLAENSVCTQSVVRNYFLHGMLPPEGQVCGTDQTLFPPNNTLITPLFSRAAGAA